MSGLSARCDAPTDRAGLLLKKDDHRLWFWHTDRVESGHVAEEVAHVNFAHCLHDLMHERHRLKALLLRTGESGAKIMPQSLRLLLGAAKPQKCSFQQQLDCESGKEEDGSGVRAAENVFNASVEKRGRGTEMAGTDHPMSSRLCVRQLGGLFHV